MVAELPHILSASGSIFVSHSTKPHPDSQDNKSTTFEYHQIIPRWSQDPEEDERSHTRHE